MDAEDEWTALAWSEFEGTFDDGAPMAWGEWSELVGELSDLFETGWNSADFDSEDAQQAREDFFDWLAAYDIDLATFDWEDFRDRYKEAA